MTKPKPGSQRQLAKKKLRKCVTCDTIKNLSEFYLRKNGYYTSQCKECIRTFVNTSYRKNPEPKKSYQRRFYRENREYYDNYENEDAELRSLRQDARKYPIDDFCHDCRRSREELEKLGIRLERHHESYQKPEEFRTICSECHGKTRRIDNGKGESNVSGERDGSRPR